LDYLIFKHESLFVQINTRGLARHLKHKNYTHIRMDIEDGKAVEALFKKH